MKKTFRKSQLLYRFAVCTIIYLLLSAHVSCEEVKPRQWNDPIPMTITLAEPPQSLYTHLITAQFESYYTKSGLKVKLDVSSGAQEALRLVAEGKSTFAVVSSAQLVAARANKLPVISVAAIFPASLQAVVSNDDTVTSPKDFEGKTVGFTGDPLEKAIVKLMVKNAGGDAEKVVFSEVGSGGVDALLTKKVNIMSKASKYHDLQTITGNDLKIKVFSPDQYGIPLTDGLFLVASETYVNNHKLPIKALIDSARKGEEYTRNNVKQAAVMLISQQYDRFPLDLKKETESLQKLLPLMTAEAGSYEPQKAEFWKAIADWMYVNGLIPTPIDAQAAYVNL